VYAVVMTGLTVLNLVLVSLTTADFLWFPIPLICWGIGLTVHYLYGVRWVDRQVRDHQSLIEHLAEQRVA
jgi:hypothetical protein